jgi:hypothetical protein
MIRFVSIVLLLLLTRSLSAAEPTRAGPDWWSIQPIVRKDPSAGGEHPIDAFVRQKLTAMKLRPAVPAEKLTLIRRITFDLTGLPPTLEEVDAFLADSSVGAFEKIVDRLLASPAYGERWARHWLDIVRYSESHGFEYDRLRDNAWRYRDYVVRSLNSDKSYADFVREQIAGDVLSGAGRDGVIATGMLVSGPFDQAGQNAASAIIRGKAREDELEDMLGTVSQTFLGVTLNCARCHDHKFDPYTARDYYRMKAVFDGVHPGERPAEAKEYLQFVQQSIEKLERTKAQAKLLQSEIEAFARRQIMAKRDPKAAVNGDLPKPIARWAFDGDGRDSIGQLHAEAKDGAKFAGGRLVVDGKKAFAATPSLAKDLTAKTLEAWVILPTLKQAGGGVVSVQTPNGSVFDAIVFAEQKPLRWIAGSNFFSRTRDVAGTDETAKPGETIHIAITYAADGRITIYRNGQPYGDSYIPEGPNRSATFSAKQAQVVFGLRHTGGGNANLHGEIEEARLYDFALSKEQVLASFRAGIDSISLDELRAAMSETGRKAHRDAEQTIAEIESQLERLRKPTMTYAANPKQPGATHLLNRGDFEKPGQLVTAGSPANVKGPPAVDLEAGVPEADRRRALAVWMAHPDNPLTWRIIVNRVWQHHFGEGLVRTPNDFGFNGDRPTHPELLDWLAATFRDSGGRFKALHRLIVTSETYRQASTFDAKAADADAENRLLWRYSPRRLEAEAIRDSLLAVTRELDRTMYGPGTLDEAMKRRSIYFTVKRSKLIPMLQLFDAPDANQGIGRRAATTVAPQALLLMNSPIVRQWAVAMARKAATARESDREEVSPAETLRRVFQAALARDPSDDELSQSLAFLNRQMHAYQAEGKHAQAAETALADFCQTLLGLNELVYIE